MVTKLKEVDVVVVGLGWTGGILSQAPTQHVEIMYSKIGDLPAGIVVEPAKVIKCSVLVVGYFGGRP